MSLEWSEVLVVVFSLVPCVSSHVFAMFLCWEVHILLFVMCIQNNTKMS